MMRGDRPRSAAEEKVPLIDYFAEILKRRPDDWDGALPKFKDVPGGTYDVPTLLSRDGVRLFTEECAEWSASAGETRAYTAPPGRGVRIAGS